MDLNLLSIFVAVAESQSFSAAAKKLGLPKSSVSRGISSLEAELGVRLLHRTTRQVTLSTAGSALYERVSSPLATLEKAICGMPELEQEPSGELRVTATTEFGTAVLAELVTRFSARYPAVRVDLHITNRLVDLVGEGFDLGFRIAAGPLKDSSLMARKATPFGLQIFASPSYLARAGTPRSPRELPSHGWVMLRGPATLHLEGPEGAAEAAVAGKIVCDDMFVMRALVRSGAGLGVLPTFMADEDIVAGTLVRVMPEWTMRAGHVWVVWPGGEHLPRKLTGFRDFVLEALRARPLVGEGESG